MNILSYVILACWVIFLLYWIISARSVKETEERAKGLSGQLWKLLLILGAILIGNFFGLSTVIPVLSHLLIPHTGIVNTLTVILLALGLAIAILARKKLARNWSSSIAFKKDHELITTGIYRYVRHPIYTGLLLMLLGNALFFATLGAAIGFLIVIISMFVKFSQEEKLLTKHFPAAYPAYKKKTKALIPFVL